MEFQRYVAWSDYDVQRVKAIGQLVEPALDALVEDFYEEIERHPRASRVMTEGKAQVQRLKKTLRAWLVDLFSGNYDRHYLIRRWNIGRRHLEIGLDQVYTITAIARLRSGLLHALKDAWQKDGDELLLTICALNKLLDLDIAIIEDAYQTAKVDVPA
ncbi:MAG: hypothetical protein GTO53_13200 [Planctomycetales bacterium]|nr:hypothetical protein [Planctomycetales bacterium]NIM10052.1 hypothetical protein [Planctomycetales bacterium]NIN09493.1 hypothetical protein [Planctomycetales bacterium]NIN77156.1 hypothetical protein [Planctomycetales bacterium]NIO34340.1 hypothetical protein [Planctomycetales bacterium]